MDLSDPTRSVTPSLDGPVLAVLATAGHPMTVGEVAKLVVRGSEVGVRRCLARLVQEGIVTSEEMGRNRVHELNRDHIAAQVAELLASLRPELFRRIRAELTKWHPKPYYACVFGAAASGDGGTTSEIDMLLVHAPFPGDPKPPRQKRHRDSSVQTMFSPPPPVEATEAEQWPGQIQRLREDVRSWTGNRAQVADLTWTEWVTHREDPGTFAEIRRDAIDVTPRSTFSDAV
jgi:DNA-binding transcriptional ArsR family regulator